METRKPIKRNPFIAEFSRDHHFTLLLVWKIRQGLKKMVPAERISRYVLHFFKMELVPHFKNEEALLFSKISSDNKLKAQAEAEHIVICDMIAGLEKDNSSTELLRQFADTLEKHVRFEERQLFNYLQENIPENELAKIASELKAIEHETETAWEDAFWK